RKPNERIYARRDSHCNEALVLPGAAEPPALEVHVRETPLLHRFHRPIGGFPDIGRTRETRPIDVGQVALYLHYLRSLQRQAFFFDTVHGVEVDLLADGPVG